MTDPQQIIPHLYVTTRAANIFILDDEADGVIIIDTGIPGSTKQILNQVEAIGRKPADVKHILITHADTDHVGSLAGLVKETGAKVYAGKKSIPYIETAKSPPHVPFPMSIFGLLAQTLFQKKATVDHALEDGDILDLAGGIQVITAPGHTLDNICFFWQREKVLFGADLLNAMFSNKFALTLPMITWDMDKARQSAKKVLALNPRIICLGHGIHRNIENPDDASEVQSFLNSLN